MGYIMEWIVIMMICLWQSLWSPKMHCTILLPRLLHHHKWKPPPPPQEHLFLVNPRYPTSAITTGNSSPRLWRPIPTPILCSLSVAFLRCYRCVILANEETVVHAYEPSPIWKPGWQSWFYFVSFGHSAGFLWWLIVAGKRLIIVPIVEPKWEASQPFTIAVWSIDNVF